MQKEINVVYGTIQAAARARMSGDYYSAMIANEFGAMGEYVVVMTHNDECAIDECFAAAANYGKTELGAGETARLVSVTHHMPGNVGARIYHEVYNEK